MKKVLETYIEISDYLEDEVNSYTLNKIRNSYEENKFYLPVMGQFSSGKSKLINNLLGRELLPVKTTETTAFITYIEYGDDKVTLKYEDDSYKEITFEQLLDLNQVSLDKENSSENKIKSIHIKLKNDILKNGIVLIDTPGINTIISNHEELTFSILPSAQFLVYVMGKSPTATDINELKRIRDMGIETIVVRTRIDDIKFTEETIEEVVNEELQILKSQIHNNINYFPITNLQELLEKEEWKISFKKLENYIKLNIVENMEVQFVSSINKRLLALKKDFIYKLTKKQSQIKEISKMDHDKVKQSIEIMKIKIYDVDKNMRILSKEIKNSIRPINSTIDTEIRKLSNEYIIKYEESLQGISDSSILEKSVEDNGYEIISEFIKESNKVVEKKLEQTIKESENIYMQELDCLKETISSELNLNFDFNTSNIDVSKIYEDRDFKSSKINEKIEELESYLNNSDEELEKLQIKREEVSKALEMVEGYKEKSLEDIGELEPYETQYITTEEGNTATSESFKNIGVALDWITLLLPGKAISSGGAKLANIVGKSGKFTNVAKTTTMVAKGAGKADKTKDVLFTLKNLGDKFGKAKDKLGEQVQNTKNKLDEVKKENPGILDYLTFEYWFTEGGQLFDTQPRVEVDREYEILYFNKKNELQKTYNEHIRYELKQLEELDLLRSEELRIKKEKEIKEKYRKKLESQLKMEEESMKKRSQDLAIANLISQSKALFVKKIHEMRHLVIEKIEQVINQSTQGIIDSYTMELVLQLNELRSEMELILKQEDNSDIDSSARISQLENYIEKLENQKV